MKKLYHHPELGLLRGRSFQPLRTEHLPLSGDQVRVLQNSTDGESAVYGFVYEGQWVDNPYLLHVRSAFTSLWNGPQPLTLVFAYGDVLRDGELDPRVVELLQRTSARLASSLLPPDR